MSSWQLLTDGDFVGGELEIQLGRAAHQLRGRISAISPNPIHNQADFKFDWMAALRLPGMQWTRLVPDIPTDLCMMLIGNPQHIGQNVVKFRAIVREVGLHVMLPTEPLLCTAFPSNGDKLNFREENEDRFYDPRKQLST